MTHERQVGLSGNAIFVSCSCGWKYTYPEAEDPTFKEIGEMWVRDHNRTTAITPLGGTP